MSTIKTQTADFITFTLNGSKPRKLTKLTQGGDSNAKLTKNSGYGYDTIGLSMSPEKLSFLADEKTINSWIGQTQTGVNVDGWTSVNSCPMASLGCKGACLDHQGMGGVFASIALARQARTIAWNEYRSWFIDKLHCEIEQAEFDANKVGNRLACRLNVFSDIPWERFGIIDAHPNVAFYDYTKLPNRAGLLRPNYWLTLSRSEDNHEVCLDALSRGINVACVFADSQKPRVGNKALEQELPKRFEGFNVIDGNVTDLRFLDVRGRKYGRWVGLQLRAISYAERELAIASGFPIVWR